MALKNKKDILINSVSAVSNDLSCYACGEEDHRTCTCANKEKVLPAGWEMELANE